MKRTKLLLAVMISFLVVMAYSFAPAATAFAADEDNENVIENEYGDDGNGIEDKNVDDGNGIEDENVDDGNVVEDENVDDENVIEDENVVNACGVEDEDEEDGGDEYGDEEEDEFALLEVGGKTILGEVDSTVKYYPENCPKGVSYNESTSELILDNATINTACGDEYFKSYINSYMDELTIVLKGENTFAGVSDVEWELCGIEVGWGKLHLKGASADASLTIDMSAAADCTKTGIRAEELLEIDNCNLILEGGDRNSDAYYYGICLDAWQNYANAGEESDEYYQILIKNSNIKISSTLANDSRAANMGIDSQDSHMTIVDSRIDINMTGGSGYGMACGLYDEEADDGSYFGGCLKIDDKSVITVHLNEGNPDYALTHFGKESEFSQNFQSPSIYSANMETGVSHSGAEAISEHTWISERSECTDTYLEFSPYTISMDGASYVYDGAAKEPAVTVKDASGNSVESTVTYSNNVNAGAGIAKVSVGGYTFDRFFPIAKAKQTITVPKTSITKTYGNAAFSLGAKASAGGKLSYSSSNTKVATVSTAGKVTIKGAGTAKITVNAAATSNYNKAAAKVVTIKVNKAANPLTIKARTATVKYSAVKKRAQTLGVTKVIYFTKKGVGTMTYTKVSGNKKITVAKSTGKVTVKKGLKKGSYKVKVRVSAGGNANYKASAVKTVTFTVRVK